MKVEIRLFATFRKGRFKRKELAFERNEVSIYDVLNLLEIDRGELGIALINGKFCPVDTGLKDGDVIALFPPIGGG